MITSDRAFDVERKLIKRIYDVFPFSAIEINEDYQEDIIEFRWKMIFKGRLLNHVESVRREAFLHVYSEDAEYEKFFLRRFFQNILEKMLGG